MNAFKSFILMLGLTLVLVWLGSMIGGRNGMIMAFVFAAVMNFVSYWFSDKIVLAMYGAKEIQRADNPEIHAIVEKLTQTAGLPMPKLYIMQNSMPNAFATGRNPQHAAVAVTTGILDILDSNELTGVIAHELSHVGNRDILISSIAATIAGAIFMLSNMARFAAMFGGLGGGRDNDNRGGAIGIIAAAIIAPLAAMIIQMAISRSREYMADESGAKLSGNPLWLASALGKLESASQHSRRPSTASPATAHMFIVNPLNGKSFLTLFSTHPPVEQRIARLEKMAEDKANAKIPKFIY